MSQFETKPKSRFLLILPSNARNKKIVKWISALSEAISANHQLYIAEEYKVYWPELKEFAIEQAIDNFCDQNSKLTVLVPSDLAPHNLRWFNPNKQKIIVYGFEKTSQSKGILLDICDGILWMDSLPESIQPSVIPSYQISTRAKTKWKKFVDFDWWKDKPRKTAIEFYDMKNYFTENVQEIKRSYELKLDALQANYREEIKAWSEATIQKPFQPHRSENEATNLELQSSSLSTIEKKLHAKEVYIQDLETRLGRYENQTLYVIWHQLKQFVNIVLIRLPLTIFLLGYHIFNIYYHRYQSSKKQL